MDITKKNTTLPKSIKSIKENRQGDCIDGKGIFKNDIKLQL